MGRVACGALRGFGPMTRETDRHRCMCMQPALGCYVRCEVGAERGSEWWVRGTLVLLYSSL
jgi:hypothetical protein